MVFSPQVQPQIALYLQSDIANIGLAGACSRWLAGQDEGLTAADPDRRMI